MADEQGISCIIFRNNEPEIKNLTGRINKARDVSQKIKVAEEMLEKVNEQLTCQKFDKDNFECRNCRTLSEVRKETAELIIKMKKLI